MTNTVSITNTGCIRCDNRCREHLDKMFLFFDSFPVCIGICENHTGQIDLFLFFDLFQKERIDLDIFFAAVYVTQMLPCNFSLRARFIYQHTHRTATKPKTQNIRPHPTTKHVIITAAAASSVAASVPGNRRRVGCCAPRLNGQHWRTSPRRPRQQTAASTPLRLPNFACVCQLIAI